MSYDRNGLEILGRNDCLRLLADTNFGRVGVSVGAIPVVLPVNFMLHEEQILICTAAGTKLNAALDNKVVAFEIDGHDPFEHTGWSVVVTGQASEAVDGCDLESPRHAALARWAPKGEGRVMAISTAVISGRRLTHRGFGHNPSATKASSS